MVGDPTQDMAVSFDKKPGAYQLLVREATSDDMKLVEALKVNSEALRLYGEAKYNQARDRFEQALKMFHQLYPKERYPHGHLEVVNILNNLGFVVRMQGNHAQEETFFRDAHKMCRELYPKARYPQGHPELAQTLSNLGLVLETVSQAIWHENSWEAFGTKAAGVIGERSQSCHDKPIAC